MMRFTVGKGRDAARFDRAPLGTVQFVDQRKGFRLLLGMRAY